MIANGTYNSMYCIPFEDYQCYSLEVRDRYSDGICCRHGYGYYNLYWGDIVVWRSLGTYRDVEITNFCDVRPRDDLTRPPTIAKKYALTAPPTRSDQTLFTNSEVGVPIIPRPVVNDTGFEFVAEASGWFDIQCQGAPNDYCRYSGNPPIFTCVLAGFDDFGYEKTPQGFYERFDFPTYWSEDQGWYYGAQIDTCLRAPTKRNHS